MHTPRGEIPDQSEEKRRHEGTAGDVVARNIHATMLLPPDLFLGAEIGSDGEWLVFHYEASSLDRGIAFLRPSIVAIRVSLVSDWACITSIVSREHVLRSKYRDPRYGVR